MQSNARAIAAGAGDAALLAITYGAGLRRHEVVGLDLADYDDVMTDSSSLASLAELIPEVERERIKEELKQSVNPRLAPDLQLYFELLLDGYGNREIAEKRMLPSLRERPISHQMLARYRNRVKALLKKHCDIKGSDDRVPSHCA